MQYPQMHEVKNSQFRYTIFMFKVSQSGRDTKDFTAGWGMLAFQKKVCYE